VPTKIVITPEDLRDPRIDEVLERERAFREAASRMRPVGGLRRFFLSSTFYLAIVGALGGFLGWAIWEPAYDDAVRVSGKITRLDPADAFSECRRCGFIFSADDKAPGKDACPKCGNVVAGSIWKGSFRLARLTVHVAPGETTRLKDGKRVPLEQVGDLRVGDTVLVLGQSFENDPLAVLAMEVRPLADPADGPGEPDLAGRGKANHFAGVLWFATVGGLVALMIGAVEGVLSLNAGQAIKSGLIGLAIGALGGGIGILPASLLYGVTGDMIERMSDPKAGFGGVEALHGGALFAQVVSRSLAWGVVGMALGLGRGVAMQSRRLVTNGLIGGLVGGLFGGMLFDPIGKLFESDSGDLPRAVGFTCIGLLVGLCLGLVEQLSKEAWLLLRTGPLQGKQFVVHRSPTTIGGQGSCDIFLFKDAAVGPEHARLNRVGRAFEIEDLGSIGRTLVNGHPVDRRILRDGDLITIGSTQLEFRSRGS
jgi:hypothetical protein